MPVSKQNPLRLDRRRRHLPGGADRRRRALVARHPDGAAGKRIRLVARHHRACGLDQPDSLRLHRAVRRRDHGAVGIRRSVVCALALVAAGVASTSMMQYPWQLILMWGFVVGTGTGFLATVLSAMIAARWFTARRGLVVGILSGGARPGNCCSCRRWRTSRRTSAGAPRCSSSQPSPARSFRSCSCSCATGRRTWA